MAQPMESSYEARTVSPRKLFSEAQETTVLTQAVSPPAQPCAGKLTNMLKSTAISLDTYCAQGSQVVPVKRAPLHQQSEPKQPPAKRAIIPKDIDTPLPMKQRNVRPKGTPKPKNQPPTRLSGAPKPMKQRDARPKGTPKPRIPRPPRLAGKPKPMKQRNARPNGTPNPMIQRPPRLDGTPKPMKRHLKKTPKSSHKRKTKVPKDWS